MNIFSQPDLTSRAFQFTTRLQMLGAVIASSLVDPQNGLWNRQRTSNGNRQVYANPEKSRKRQLYSAAQKQGHVADAVSQKRYRIYCKVVWRRF